MCNVICVANLVKGVGRTSTAVNFAASLSLLEKKTLIVDCDPAAHASSYLGFNSEMYDYGLDDLMLGLVGWRGVVRKTSIELLDCVPAGLDLGSIQKKLALNPDKEKVLSIVIKKFKDDYDYILFDTPSDKGFLTRSVLQASDSILIPEKSGLESINNLYNILGFASDIRKDLKTSLKVAGILFVMTENIDKAQHNFSAEAFNEFKHAIYPITIPDSEMYGRSVQETKPACLIDIKSDFSEAFLDLSFEFLYRDNVRS